MTTTEQSAIISTGTDEFDTLRNIQSKILWLTTSIVDAANRGREKPTEVKVGGHQASCASMSTIMTSLWFSELTSEDRVSVKPHAGPMLHAINYLLGNLDRSYLPTLRRLGGLQSYPSRIKDPDPVDFSTGSVGIGATAPIWAAMSHRFMRSRGMTPSNGGRWISLLGDAELDEGAIWEAVNDPSVSKLGEVLWIVDLNRQSLDRVIPDIAFGRLEAMFEAAGWQVLTCKWGLRIQQVFAAPGGDWLKARMEAMPNEEYQAMLRADAAEVRRRIVGDGPLPDDARALLDSKSDAELADLVRDLGGHDLELLLRTYGEVDPGRPTVVFAYTIKGWRLPTEGHPSNHSALLTGEQMEVLAETLGCSLEDRWATFAPDSVEAQVCRDRAVALHRDEVELEDPYDIPISLGRPHTGAISTQAALGRILLDLRRAAPEVAERVVTVSPDVASSTNLGGWINQVGVWNVGERYDWFSEDKGRLLRWVEHTGGQHIELGIAEVNLVGLLGELGATWSRTGKRLLPIGTIYDPFVSRALEPWSFGIYAGGQSILIGTPSGVTLAPEGGAHQSIGTPSIGIEQPGCVAWEPAFAQDLEWALLDALGELGRPDGSSAYFRLTTRPLDQALAGHPTEPELLERRRRFALSGGYRIGPDNPKEEVTLVGVGAIMREVIAAHDRLEELGVPSRVLCLTSPDLLFRALQARRGLGDNRETEHGVDVLEHLFPSGRRTPIVTVLDGHPHSLAFLAGVRGDPVACLGVSRFGQSGDVPEVYEYHGIDEVTIVGASLDLLDI